VAGDASLSEIDDLVDALSPVVSAFRGLGIRHYISGSVASSFHGAARSTMDVDVVCEMSPAHVSRFVEQFGSDFYVSEPAIQEAIKRKSCFNLIHLPTSFKVDVFVSRRRPFDLNSMSRATIGCLGINNSIEVPIATAEDSIISKLEWYRKSNETSERQWDDVSRLIALLGNAADFDYLRSSAESVAVTDLLERLLDDRTK
jgi:hypothetical protein